MINQDFLTKLGWVKYSLSRGIEGMDTLFVDDEMVRFFFVDGNRLFVIKESNSDIYNFIIVQNVKSDLPSFMIHEFNSNLELNSLIKKNLACNTKYKRIFKLNTINEERS